MAQPTNLLPAIQEYLSAAEKEWDQISQKRKDELLKLGDFVGQTLASGASAELVFICTHNSRRSHMSQIWAQVAAVYYGVKGVTTYSGGTEATAFNPRAVKAMQEAGLEIQVEKQGENPVYAVRYSASDAPLRVWSKAFDDAANPQTAFAAIMTCSHADENCPFIPGATRLPIRYSDPKAFDGTAQEAEKYSERSRQIAREMLYAFSHVAQK